MSHLSIDEYIEQIMAELGCIISNHYERYNHEIRIRFNNTNLTAEGIITIACSLNTGKVVARISYINDIMAKKDTITFRDTDAKTVATHAKLFLDTHETSIADRLQKQTEFRLELDTLLRDIFKRTCDSKYLTSFTSPKMSLMVKYADDGTFIAQFKHSRKRTGTKEVFQFENTANKEQAANLAALVKMKYSEP